MTSYICFIVSKFLKRKHSAFTEVLIGSFDSWSYWALFLCLLTFGEFALSLAAGCSNLQLIMDWSISHSLLCLTHTALVCCRLAHTQSVVWCTHKALSGAHTWCCLVHTQGVVWCTHGALSGAHTTEHSCISREWCFSSLANVAFMYVSEFGYDVLLWLFFFCLKYA